jgi:hypothetical protein
MTEANLPNPMRAAIATLISLIISPAWRATMVAPRISSRPFLTWSFTSGRDEHSIVADAQFVDPAQGDYRVKEGSPALSLGFVNLPMNRFGVQRPALKALARTPVLPRQKPVNIKR